VLNSRNNKFIPGGEIPDIDDFRNLDTELAYKYLK